MEAAKLEKAKKEEPGDENLAQVLKDERWSDQIARQPTDRLPD
jgi:hypothetical protein